MREYCHVSDCANFIDFEWDGSFVDRYYCPDHAKEEQEYKKGVLK